MSGFEYLRFETERRVPEVEEAQIASDEIVDFDHSAVDFDHLQRFTMGNRNLEEEVLNLFRTQSVIYMQRLQDAADDKGWREAAHTLKGSAAGIGAHKVREAATLCEQLCGTDRHEKGPKSIARLQKTLDEANLLIAKFLND